MLDRIDIHVEVPSVPYQELNQQARRHRQQNDARAGHPAPDAIQLKRFGDGTTNARMDSRALRTHCELSDRCMLLMKQAMDEMGLSARAYDKIRRVARTLADMAGIEQITEDHVAEAVQYRLLDRKF